MDYDLEGLAVVFGVVPALVAGSLGLAVMLAWVVS